MKAERARQFLPFAALRGFDEMLREIERETEPKRELTEEDARRLDEEMKAVRKGSHVHIIHYKEGTYVKTEGKIDFIDQAFRRLFVGEEKISFDNIWNLNISRTGHC